MQIQNNSKSSHPSRFITTLHVLTWFCLFLLLFSQCTQFKKVNRTIKQPQEYESLDQRSPFLKAHMKDGRVYVLADWRVQEPERLVVGNGFILSVNRDTLDLGDFSVSLDSVVIFETNVVQTSPAVAALTIITGISAAISIACLSNPKACFGSCPTFYASDGNNDLLQAEGFSSSIAPWLEDTDIDALYRIQVQGKTLRLEMRNEALETHVVRSADVLISPKPVGGRILKDTQGKFWEVLSQHPLTIDQSMDEDVLPLLQHFDGEERFSLADSTDLSSKETLDFEFDSPADGKAGLIIAVRHSLLSTYLLYQTLAYMGTKVGDWFALYGKAKHDPDKSRLASILGRIEVLVQDSDGNWQLVDEVGEHGPLATDIYLVHLPESVARENNKIRLRLTKGTWRLDYVALACIGNPVKPDRIQPSRVLQNGVPNKSVLELLTDSSQVLVTLPGDAYTLEYDLPVDSHNSEFFLESRGYYLEWIRQEWLAEENPGELAKLLFGTKTALKRLAPEFKKMEPGMEEAFWRSRYAKP